MRSVVGLRMAVMTCHFCWALGLDPQRSDAPRSDPVSQPVARLEQVVVTGEQPGPRLWKLTRDGHVLWILGTVTQKPRDITWRSQEVADVLESTQSVVDQQLQGSPWAVNIALDVKGISPLAGLRVARRAKKLRESLPATPALRDALPADVYDRYAKLKSIYLPNDKTIESQAPRVAAGRLYNAALASKGLTTRALIHEEVHKLARARRVNVDDITKTYVFDLETMIQVQLESAQPPPTVELSCFIETLEDLETNLPLIAERANAWATGDVEKLRRLPSLLRGSCGRASWSAQRWTNLDAELDHFWISTIEGYVAKNKSTLAMLDMSELLEPDGLVHVLGRRGFAIEGP